MKAFQTPAPRPADVDVPLSRLEADMRALVARQRQDALASAYQHQPEPMEAEFAELAIHPTRQLATEADYPAWTPPHLETAS